MPPPDTLLTCLLPIERREFLPAPLDAELTTLAGRVVDLDSAALSPAAWADALRRENPEVILACWNTPALPDPIPPALRYVCYLAGSIKKLVTRQQVEAGLLVTNWHDSISRVVAESALMHILGAGRRTTEWTLAMHLHGAWKQRETRTASLFGRRVGIRGFGNVARELLKLLAPFGCDVGVLAPDLTPALAAAHGIRMVDSLESLMQDHDVVVELAPLTPTTHRSITARHLALLRPGTIFVNVGRGATVDEAALLEVARCGEVLICLDVFGEEPLPVASGFRGLANVALTPHLAGPTTDRRVDSGRFALQNIAAYAAGAPLRGLITAERYDQTT